MPLFRDLRPAARWRLALLSILTLGVVIAAGVPTLRHSLLRSAGWALVAEDPPAKADIIVISTDALGAGILEAADLVHAGFARRIAIFDRPATRISREFARRGVQSLDLKNVSIQLLHGLGITDIAVIPPVVGTVDEGKVLQQWCAANSIHSILFVSVADHSRRTRRVLDRALIPGGIRVMVRYARYSEFDPDSWWQTRGGQRTQAVESQKLLMDILRHPL
ncbi:MAG TPA: hypothetical protein VGO18_09225 [Steroidobacteraceae bacterium]|jgi:uncharacterized SAM-binding protein YcdF (DUF218 family)|nr:hypothetical protein [Steroidobacteraceae bacterium]